MLFVAAILILLFGAGLIFNPHIAVLGIKSGYSLCFDVLFPSLFPFMIISEILILTPAGRALALPLKILFSFLKLPRELAELFLTSILGGYPVGAKALSILKESGEVSDGEASDFIRFLINSGPGFAIMAVGRMLYGSVGLGVIFYVSQLFSSLLVGKFFYGRGRKVQPNLKQKKYMSYSDALVTAVYDASQSMIIICGYVFLFSIISEFVNFLFKGNPLSLGITGILEVTYAVGLLKNMPFGILFTAFLISFGGISVICQVKSICQKSGIATGGIMAVKLLQGICSAAITFILLKFFPVVLSAGAIAAAPIKIYSSNRILMFFSIAAMFVMSFCHKENNLEI